MQLKIGDLAQRVGLSVRALHHYDAIGLLCPSQRSAGGARLYGRDDFIRLNRIEALKQLGWSLPDIQAALDRPGKPAPLDWLQHQIDALNAKALQAQRLSQHLQTLKTVVAAGGDTAADDWLNILELMHMYRKHLNDDEIQTLLRPGPSGAGQTESRWLALVAEVRQAMDDGLKPDSPEAQALAWRWMRLALHMTDQDSALAAKLMQMQNSEPRAQDIVGITPAMFAWVNHSFVHARCTLLAKHLSADQVDQVRQRQLQALAHPAAWPRLAAELRVHLQQGTDPADAAVQDIARRWQRLFRDNYCGDDAALEARVRNALMHESDLRLGVSDELLSYLHRAHLVTHAVNTALAGPKPSAWMVALQRAAHQLIEAPPVLDDPLALAMLAPQEQAELRANLARYREPMAQGLRSSVVVRSRLAEDEWAAARRRGVRQYVVLGAGLDTSALRHPLDADVALFEVDLPSTQAWKRQRLQEAGITPPRQLHWVPVDFETVSLAQGLAQAGFDASQPAYFSWLGVTMYLDEAAVIDTLRFIAGCAPGSEVVFEYVVPLTQLPAMMRNAMQQMASLLAARGEPWKCFFDSDALSAQMQQLGFASQHLWTPEGLNQRYLTGRSDGLHIGAGPGRLMQARV